MACLLRLAGQKLIRISPYTKEEQTMKAYKIFAAAITMMMLAFGLSNTAYARTRVVVKVAPPAPKKVVVVKKSPYKHGVWVSGHWEWKKGRYVWHEGHWVKAKPGFRWVEGHWKHTAKGWVWIPGHWKKF